MDVREPRLGYRDRKYRGPRVPRDFAGLASTALPGPTEDVAAHATPRVRLGDDRLRGTSGGVCKIVYGVEYGAATSFGD